ncbi:CcdB family protein [Thalassospira lucentensis]|uniref:CcdB family protein n=1 Tax=Thalassospira lucentensis TaxID=168935 RepID=UPI00142E71E7|nr:CcdB family protein [Thalassospira lucentensis]NIZ01508.1 plasmid maintenance protein CcdB [Thalassospira lucentensis]
MARGDIFRFEEGYVVDVQAELLSDFRSRVVVPLKSTSQFPLPADRLNPVIKIGGDDWVRLPQFIATLSTSELGEKAGEFEDAFKLTNALNMVFHGI